MIVVGIDPPQGWAIWGRRGVVAAGEGRGANTRLARRDALKNLIEALPAAPYAWCVELPYGTKGQDDPEERLQSLLSNAESAGWWQGALERLGGWERSWTPTASEWRRFVGIRGVDRATAKALAVRIGGRAFTETHGGILTGPRGGEMSHAAEAICVSMALWNRLDLGAGDEQDSLRLFITTNHFRLGAHNDYREGPKR